MITENIPACLRDCPQWVAWRYIVRDGRETKGPVNPHTGGFASATDPSTWGTFQEVTDACQQDADLAGVGFVFTPDDPFCGVDLDDSLDAETGQLKPWAARLVEQLASYTEISPSSQGVKVFLRASKSGSRCRKAVEDGEIEIYDRDRFFTVTGRLIPTASSNVETRQEQLDAVYHTVFGEDGLATTPGSNGHVHLADDEIIRLATRQRRSGPKFAALWSGDWNAHFNSASEADSSVVFTLAFYTKDAAQVDRLFRQSGLMRPKWDELHGDQTYGEMTVAKALGKVTKQYMPKARKASLRIPTGDEPCPGTIDPGTGRLILSTGRTLPTAEAFVRDFYQHPDGRGRTLHHYAGMNMAWRHSRYVELEDNAMRHQLLPWLHAAVRLSYDAESQAFVPEDFPANPNTVRAALDSIQAHTHLPATTVSPSWLTNNENQPDPREIVPCRSSLLHLPTRTTLPPTPAFFSVNALDYDPDPHAAPPDNWFRFLHQLFDGDIQSLELLQDWFGYCLTGDTTQQKMFLIVGPRRSGKGTIARVLTQLVGAGNVCGPTTSSLAGPFGLQPLIGKSLAIVSDARFSGENVQTVLERLLCVSGEDALTIDRKNMSSVTMKLPTRFVFLTNELPRLNDASRALAGRFAILRLTESFYGRENQALTQTLLSELCGILNWAIEGWMRLRDRGAFVMPSCVEEAICDMEDLSSPVGAFVRECCTVGVGHRVSVDDLYRAWKWWCEQEGRNNATTRQTFGRDLMAAVPGISCRRNYSVGRFYEGISWVDGGGF
jgi:putative DNA primase/helicase